MFDHFYPLFINNTDKFIAILLLILVSFGLRIVLEIFGQTWIKTKAHTSTIIILPIITYVITNVISGNIALSLGMVGALSIVRFRNPVRSPLELSVYFGSITMGIAASVNLIWLWFLVFSISISIIFLIITNKLSQLFFKKNFFSASFSEGNSLSSLTLKTNAENDILKNNSLLHSKSFDSESGIITYHFVSDNFQALKDIEEEPYTKSNIVSAELRK